MESIRDENETLRDEISDEIRQAIRQEVTHLLSGASSTSMQSRTATPASTGCRSTPEITSNSSETPSLPSGSRSNRTLSFEQFYRMRESQRQAGCKPAKKKKRGSPSTSSVAKKPTNVQIKVGITSQSDGTIKSRRGKTHVINVNSSANTQQIIQKAVEKHSSFDQSFDGTVAYVLLYPDYREVRNIPGTTHPFVLSEYKQAIGKDYNRLTFYLIPLDDVLENSDDSDKELSTARPGTSSDIRNYGFNPICPAEEKPNEVDNSNHAVIDVHDDNGSLQTLQVSGEVTQYLKSPH